MAEFAGYNMPIEFTGINEEHLAVRNNAGVFDVSHMGEVWVKGPKAEAFLQHNHDQRCCGALRREGRNIPPCPTAREVSWTTCWFTGSMPKLICS